MKEIFTLKEVLDEIAKFNSLNEVQKELYALVRRIKEKAKEKENERQA